MRFFYGLVPSLDFALGLGMEGRAAHMLHLVGFNVFGEIAGDIAGAPVGEAQDKIVGQQARFMVNKGWSHPDAANARSSVSVTSSARMVVQSFPAMM